MSPESETEPLHLKYRPSSFDSFIGNTSVIRAIEQEVSRKDRGHSYLICGPSGSGKTSLSRVMAQYLTKQFCEFDGPSIRDVETIRNLVREVDSGCGFRIPRTVIVDESQAITAMGWQTFLKTIEETPDHIFFIFCTTESAKVPKTIQSRCRTFTLSRPKRSELESLLETIAEIEGITPDFVAPVVTKADGNMRAALSFLSLVRDCSSKEEVSSILGSVDLESTCFTKVCNEIVSGKLTAPSLLAFYRTYKSDYPEAVRIRINDWLLNVLDRSSDDSTCKTILTAFGFLEGTAQDWPELLGKLNRLMEKER